MNEVQFIVAIGGSAGSLIPLKEFFDHTPLDSASYVIVRHLPRDYQSQLKSVLAHHSKLQIVEVSDGMPLLVNTIYIAPSDQQLIYRGGKFQLTERSTGLNRTIDLFFQSLAEEGVGDHAIAVLLSGAGFDGIKGAEAIKSAGGLVLVQDPGSCDHDTMPKKAIERGVVDLVKLPSEMPAAIQAYVQMKKKTGKAS